MEIHLKIIGACLLLLGIAHIGFPRYFKWKQELMKLSLINRQMFGSHTFFIALTVTLIGALCLTYADDLIHTALGNVLSLGLGIFWLLRLYFQLFVYSSALWKGKAFETLTHIVFSLFWGYMSFVFLSIYFQ
ncbi:MAG: hypothetical protein R2800_13890 [Flavipsychrobacter sp.]